MNTDFEAAIALLLFNKHQGENNAITAVEIRIWIKQHTGFTMPSKVFRQTIQNLRLKNIPICSSGSGYFWPAYKEELQECINSLKRRIKEQQKTVKSLSQSFYL